MLPADTPKLPKWPFLAGDAALLGLAWFIASESRNPFTGTTFVVIVSCVALGALLAVVPFLTDYARKQDEALDERQRALDALSRTVAASAEQISIAASGLHEITTLAQRNLQAAEQLPDKLQEKIAGIKNQLTSARDSEREELKKELARLRASEGERLQSAAAKLTQVVAELARLETATQKLLAARPEPIAPASLEPVERTNPAPPPESSGAPVAEITPPPRRVRKPRTEPPSRPTETPLTDTVIVPLEAPLPGPTLEEPPPLAAAIPEIVPVAPDSGPPIEVPSVAPAAVAAADTPAPEAAQAGEPAKPERKRAPRKPKPDLPAAEISALESSPPALAPSPPEEPTLGLEAPTDRSPPESAESPAPVERVVSSDGATRLLVTAYIGIGNRLFIRGAGPGLTWNKGLPLQFVSIGKWRWETSDATAPMQYKLYKNDDIESAAVGLQTLDPGQQQEVTATFP
jgi:hypothetical protein